MDANFKCKTCGALLDAFAAKSADGLVECPYCYNVWTIPKKGTSPDALASLRIGEHELDTGRFDDALAAYKKAAELDPKEPEAYFGMALAAFRVQYLKVEPEQAGGKSRLQPICHIATQKKFTESNAYLRALVNASPAQRTEYERKGAEIDYILSEFYRLKQSGADYNCFLCVKVSGENGKTEDSKDADYIYDLLQGKGYKPFYSERELRNVTGADYEARILYALARSECMLVICRNEEYLQTPWVKNEYTRFLKLVNDEEKESDSIALVFYEKPIERLPGKNGKLQGIDFSRREADGKIVDFVEAHTPAARARREAEVQNRNAQAEEIRRQIEEQKKAQQALEEKLRTLQSGGTSAPQGPSTESLLTRAKQFEEKWEYKKARSYYDRILDMQPDQPDALEGIARIEALFHEFDIDVFDRVLMEYLGNKTEVVIPDGIKKIGKKAFAGRKSLVKVTIPESVTSIGEEAFDGCEKLTSVNFTDGLIAIETRAFCGCGKLTDITIPKNLKTIGKSAFCGCGMKSLVIPSNVTSFAWGFSGCQELINVKICDGITEIPGGAFAGCIKLVDITIPESVTKIGERAFEYCSAITSFTVPDNVKTVEDDVFNLCNSLESVTIGHGAPEIGRGVFAHCPKLKKVTIESDRVVFFTMKYFTGSSDIQWVETANAFADCPSLREVTMPKTLAGGLFKPNLIKIFGRQRDRIRFTFTQ